MTNGEVKIAAARQEQSKADKSDLLNRLRNKKRKAKTLEINLDGDIVTLKFEAISSRELDKLRAKHPPTQKQRAENLGVNLETFNPALVAATLVEPKVTEDEAVELFNSDRWSAGELAQIFNTASDVCMEGLDIPRNASV